MLYETFFTKSMILMVQLANHLFSRLLSGQVFKVSFIPVGAWISEVMYTRAR